MYTPGQLVIITIFIELKTANKTFPFFFYI